MSNKNKHIDDDSQVHVDFGFKRVQKHTKSPLVRELFDSVAPRYDLMNDLMSLGLHRQWKHTMVRKLRLRKNMTVIDVASGTGDISTLIAAQTEKKGIRCKIIAADITESMLRIGHDRSIDRGFLDGIFCVVADGSCLPIEGRTIDAYTIAFGMRNITDLGAALTEAYRVLRPGGQFLCLEFGHVHPTFRQIYDLYSFRILPLTGRIFGKNEDAYRYLVESIRKFPRQQDFTALCAKVGFSNLTYTNLLGGIVTIYSAWRL